MTNWAARRGDLSLGPGHVLTKAHRKVFGTRSVLGDHAESFSGIGIEIGGPSPIFRPGDLLPVYERAERIDNVTFAAQTQWEGQVRSGDTYEFHPQRKPGKQLIAEGAELSGVPSDSYDFVLSSHMIEHTANPLKALKGWLRILRTGGRLLLVCPDHRRTFDHRRPVTTMAHLIEDSDADRPESDETHFDEVLQFHDLRLDVGEWNAESFRDWILHNEKNRGVHHHVFDAALAGSMVSHVGFDVLSPRCFRPNHIVVIATK